jgi:thiosulfate/3-mercaptopyruvate sulfurtransferase
VAAALRTGAGPVLDARAASRYRGEEEPIDPVAGHVPGARSAPWDENLGPDGRFRSPAALTARYRALGAVDASAIVYCGSGVTSCLDLVALCRAGVGMARLYVGSWSDWTHDPARAVATGPAPGSLP